MQQMDSVMSFHTGPQGRPHINNYSYEASNKSSYGNNKCEQQHRIGYPIRNPGNDSERQPQQNNDGPHIFLSTLIASPAS
jgi:hypothetical protein